MTLAYGCGQSPDTLLPSDPGLTEEVGERAWGDGTTIVVGNDIAVSGLGVTIDPMAALAASQDEASASPTARVLLWPTGLAWPYWTSYNSRQAFFLRTVRLIAVVRTWPWRTDRVQQTEQSRQSCPRAASPHRRCWRCCAWPAALRATGARSTIQPLSLMKAVCQSVWPSWPRQRCGGCMNRGIGTTCFMAVVGGVSCGTTNRRVGPRSAGTSWGGCWAMPGRTGARCR